MSSSNNTVQDIYEMELLASRNNWVNNRHALIKLIVTISFIVLVMSVDKYNLETVLLYGLYPVVLFMSMELSAKKAFIRMRFIMPVVILLGCFNPFLDQHLFVKIGNISITTGIISMCTLMIKGVLAILASYLLIVSTSIESICSALRLIHIPDPIVTQLQLTYRYIILLLNEVTKITQAYHMRAPRQKGIHYKAWGSLVGLLILRSFNRAEEVYDSMCLRGYGYHKNCVKEDKLTANDYLYGFVWIVIFFIIRQVPILTLIGNSLCE